MVSTAGMLKAGGRKRGSCRCSSASSRSAATFAPASATSLWGSRASPFASAEQACRMYSRGLRQLACWTKSEYQRIAFMLSTCRTAPKGESRPRSRAKKSVRIPGGCRLAPVLRLPRRLGLQVLFAVAGFEALPGLQGGKSGGFASSVASIRHRTWRLARPERVCTCPSHSSTGAPDTSTSSTVPGIVQSARRPAGRAGALRADVVVVPVAAALSRYDIKAARSWGGRPFAGSELTVAIAAAVGSVGLVVGLFWDGDPVLQPALRRY
eukprot:tig00020510_g9790.t1